MVAGVLLVAGGGRVAKGCKMQVSESSSEAVANGIKIVG